MNRLGGDKSDLYEWFIISSHYFHHLVNVLDSGEVLSELRRGVALLLFENPVEIRNIVKTARVANFANTFIGFYQKACGVTQPDFVGEIDK